MNLESLLIRLFDFLRDNLFIKKESQSRNSFYVGTGQSLYDRNNTEKIHLSPSEKSGHAYIIGGSGAGKTTLIENCLRHEIVQNRGFCLLDAHGDLSEKITKFIAFLWQSKERKQKEEMARRLILVEPFNQDRIVGFNPLEFSSGSSVYPCALEMMNVFKARWPDFGPRMEELFRSCLVTLGENKLTLLEMPILLTNREVRYSLVENLANQEIKDYWLYRYNKLSQGSEVQYREPVLNKVTEMLTDENIRYVLGQAKSTLDFRKAMDEGKWVILNIAKGRLKSNASLLGGLFQAKLQLAGLSRANIAPHQRRPFRICLDEFQNFINARDGGDVETLLSESRKYNLHMTVAHQNLSQLDNSLLNSILGNISALFCFRLGYKDALALAPELNPEDKNMLSANLIKLNTGEAYLKIKGKPCRLVKIPFPDPSRVRPEVVEEFKKLSASFFAKPAQEVRKEIEERHRKLGIRRSGNAAKNGSYANKENSSEDQDGW